MKIDQHTIFEIHRLNDLSWSERKIACHLRIGRLTVKKFGTGNIIAIFK